MKTYLIKIFAGLGCLISITACKKYLDVKPVDKILLPQIFSTETGIKSAINGVYLTLGGTSLYGGNLTMSTVDVIAQRYNLSAFNHSWTQYGAYNYNDVFVRNSFNVIWSDSYKQILNLNIFIQQLKQSTGILSESNARLLRGEAYGLRALLHFDLLRLFGPVYSVNSTAPAIPYYIQPQTQRGIILPANVVMQKVLADLDTASQMLVNDPIITNGTLASAPLNNSDIFYRYRNTHMNYYAVKALQARVNLYAGNKDVAQTLAVQVINEAGKWFPWTNNGLAITAAFTDRKFSPEVIFGVQNRDIYNQFNTLFRYDLTQTNILAPQPIRLGNAFAQNDYRYISWFRVPPNGSSSLTFFKFEDVITDPNDYRRFFQPLIRLSEMYYIAAETQTDPVKALQYLNTVLHNRGLTDLPATANLQTEIQKEYVREFYGEGQLFFYYKRRALTTIGNGSSGSGNINLGASQYVVPIPQSESGGGN